MIGTLFEDDRCMLLLLLFAVLSKVLVLFSTRARFVLFLLLLIFFLLFVILRRQGIHFLIVLLFLHARLAHRYFKLFILVSYLPNLKFFHLRNS